METRVIPSLYALIFYITFVAPALGATWRNSLRFAPSSAPDRLAFASGREASRFDASRSGWRSSRPSTSSSMAPTRPASGGVWAGSHGRNERPAGAGRLDDGGSRSVWAHRWPPQNGGLGRGPQRAWTEERGRFSGRRKGNSRGSAPVCFSNPGFHPASILHVDEEGTTRNTPLCHRTRGLPGGLQQSKPRGWPATRRQGSFRGSTGGAARSPWESLVGLEGGPSRFVQPHAEGSSYVPSF